MSSQFISAARNSARRLWFAAGAGLVAIGTVAVLFYWLSSVEGGVSAMSTFEVQEGPLLISVIESGTISAREQAVLKSEVEGQTQVLWLIDEGTRVKKGELLVHLDASALEDRLVDQQIAVQNAEAAYINAKENLEVVKSQAGSDVSKAELTFRFAQEDLQKYLDGDYPMQVKEAKARITLSEADLARAQEDLRGKERLFEKAFVTVTELEASKRAHQKATLDLELAGANLQLLEEYTHKRQQDELESNIEEAEKALDRARLKASSDVVQAEANLRAKESELTRQRSKLEKNEEQIAKAKVYAPMDGMVVHGTTGGGRGPMSTQEPLREGQMVRERQDLIYLPTASEVMAKVSIHESNLTKVRPGLGARITVDALPGEVFTGRVATIAHLPDAQSMWMNPDLKVYSTEVYIDGDGSELRTGMSCRVEIMVEHHEKTMFVPVQCVTLVRGNPTVYVVNGNRTEPREVEVGLDNNRMIRIASGLKLGERVLLNPPLAPAAADADEEAGRFVPDGPVERTIPAQEGPAGSGATPEGGSIQNMTPDQLDQMRRRFEGASPEVREQMRRQFENMTPEEREQMRKRFENMTPEERETYRERMRGGGRSSDGETSSESDAGSAP